MAGVGGARGQPLFPGQAHGEVLAARVPLSFWGGYDAETGRIIDQRHPLVGRVASGKILVIPGGRGSCSGSGVLLEAIRNQTAPAAIVTSSVDPIICLGAVLGEEVYGRRPVVLVMDARSIESFRTGDVVSIDETGQVHRLCGDGPTLSGH